MNRNIGAKPFALIAALVLVMSWLRLDPGTGGSRSGGNALAAGDGISAEAGAETGTAGPDGAGSGQASAGQAGQGGAGGGATPGRAGLKCDAASNGGATDTGVTANRIRLATTAVLDGPAKSLLEDSPKAMKAVVDKVNQQGGVCGRLLDLRVVNDSFKADVGLRTIENFIDEGYFAMPVVPSAEGLGSAITSGVISKAGIPVIGTDGMRNEQYGDPWVWPVASATVTAMRVMAKFGFTQRGARTFAIVYDEKYQFGREGKDAFLDQVRKLGGRVVDGGVVGLNPDDASYASTIQQFNDKCQRGTACDMVALLLLPETAKKWLQGGGAFGGKYSAGAQTLFTDRFAQDCVLVRAGGECNGFAVWTGYNPPIGALATKPGVSAYVNDIRAVKPGIDINNQFVEGAYLGMSVFVEALRKVGPDLTRKRLREVMDAMAFTNDLASTLTWTPGHHAANVRSQSFSITVSQGTFRGWSDEGTGFLLDPAHGG